MTSKPWLAAAAAGFFVLATACTTTPEPPPPPEPDTQPLPSTYLERLSADGLFAFGKSGIDDLSDEGRVALDELAARLVERPVEIVHVIGHSDRIGTPTAIHRVSSERANAVRDYLIERGVPEDRITAVGRGGVEPVVECSDERGQALVECLAPNRRVEVRVSYGESFRAPQFSDLFGNSSAMFVEAFVDPTIGGAPRQGVFQSGGNPDLQPETAETWSIGLDWDVAALGDTSLSLTYFHVDYENQIAQYLGDRNILQREGEFEGTGLILRDAAAAARIDELFAQGLTVARGVLPDPVTLYVDGRPNNLGRSETDGVDFMIRSAWSTDGGSNFVANVSGVYTLDYKVANTPNGTLFDRDNVIFNPLGLKARASLMWGLDRYSARVMVHYVGGYDNNLPEPDQSVDAFAPVDLEAWIDLGDPDGTGLADGWVLGFEVSNVFDEDPPYVNVAPSGNGNGGYDSSAANPIGRLFGISLEKSF